MDPLGTQRGGGGTLENLGYPSFVEETLLPSTYNVVYVPVVGYGTPYGGWSRGWERGVGGEDEKV